MLSSKKQKHIHSPLVPNIFGWNRPLSSFLHSNSSIFKGKNWGTKQKHLEGTGEIRSLSSLPLGQSDVVLQNDNFKNATLISLSSSSDVTPLPYLSLMTNLKCLTWYWRREKATAYSFTNATPCRLDFLLFKKMDSLILAVLWDLLWL